jgi:hypothetical protein
MWGLGARKRKSGDKGEGEGSISEGFVWFIGRRENVNLIGATRKLVLRSEGGIEVTSTEMDRKRREGQWGITRARKKKRGPGKTTPKPGRPKSLAVY